MNLMRHQVEMPSLLGVDRWFDDLLGDGLFGSSAVPAVDIRETTDSFVMEVDLPGYSEKDVEVKLDNRLLTLFSKREDRTEEKKDGYLLRERRSAEFRRSFVLPDGVDRERIDAQFKEGVLTLSFPKLPAAKAKVIEVKKS